MWGVEEVEKGGRKKGVRNRGVVNDKVYKGFVNLILKVLL